MHLLLWGEDSEAELRSEVAEAFPGAPAGDAGPWLIASDFEMASDRSLPHLVFARQLMPHARPVSAESVRAWAGLLLDAIAGVLPDGQPWSLQIEPHYGSRANHRIGARAWHSRRVLNGECRTQNEEGGRGEMRGAECGMESEEEVRQAVVDPEAGRHRCRLIREALMELMKRKRRHLLRRLRREPAGFAPEDSLVQLLLTAPEAGFVSVACAPIPFQQRHLISPFPKGELPVASDKAAPSRAFAKLVEAEARLGRLIGPGETCVDLGASPGSWTYVAVNRGARVTAVDRSPLRQDLMENPLVEFRPGDAFQFKPSRPVDWLLCDVIAAPERTAELLLEWLRRGWCRRFVVTIKLKDAERGDVLGLLKRQLPPLARDLFLMRLCANKKEACAFGSRE
jgi:23S rRNA (cytidine2498-2'-O)-methyltransferase